MTEMSSFAANIMGAKYALKDKDNKPIEDWNGIAKRVVTAVCGQYIDKALQREIYEKISLRKFIPGGRYLYAAGRQYHQVNNCFLYRGEDSREGWSDLLRKCSMSLMSGGGVGVDYSAIREEGAPIRKTGGFSSGPLSVMQMVNEVGRHVMQGGSRRSAIWAGLNWQHQDTLKFIHLKDWSEDVRNLKAKDFNFPATMDMTNVSIILDKDFFSAFDNEKNPKHALAKEIYYETCKQMFKKSEPGFSVDYNDASESLRNACTEITSSDDSDCCNLGSINLGRIESLEELKDTVELATMFLVCGSLYSDIPHAEVLQTRDKNRRIGLGLMGIHEWLLLRGYSYGETSELSTWLKTYEVVSRTTAKVFSEKLGVSTPIKQRAVAPTGTIGIVAETTTGIEPIFATAFKRRYLKGKTWVYEYVVDPTAKRLIESGIKEEAIEDAYDLSRDLSGFERRIQFQADVQRFIDHGISSTINLPAWGSEANNENNVRERADILYRYLPSLRGVTCYADGSRGGQPLTNVLYSTAARHVGNVIEEAQDVCDLSGRGGSCGS